MSRPVVLGLILVIGALAVLALWLEPAGRAGLERAERESVPSVGVEPDASTSLLRADDRDATRAEAKEGTVLSEAATTLAAQRAPAPDQRPRISGTVRVPGGIPAGEAVRVRAEVFPTAASGGTGKLGAPVASDGSFTLVVPEDTDHASLDLDARFLVLGKAVVARPGERGVVLEPLVYATIEGEVVPPQSLSTLGVSWATMKVSWSFDSRRDLGLEATLSARRSPSRHEAAEPDHDGVFELSYVPVGLELELHAQNPFGPEWIQRLEPLSPAERRKITIALEPGITISGRVIDEHGQPVTGILVLGGKDELMERRRGFSSTTDKEGRFVLARMPRRVTEISALGTDLLQGAEATVDGTSGDVRDVVLSVVRGGCIEGTVVWADRSPVEHFKVSAICVAQSRREVGQDGRFRFCGLGAGGYQIDVRAKGHGVVGTARVLDAQPGAAPLQLVLAEARAFDAQGVVVDREGAPVRRFSVSAMGPAPDYRNESADGYGGRLLLKGLAPGEWSFVVSAKGYQEARQRVSMGEELEPLRFELMPAGRIRGRVVDPAGAPVAGAWVGDESRSFVATSRAGLGDEGTDAAGRFDIEADSAHVRLQARKAGFSPSPVIDLDVEPEESVDGLVLRLREACRIEGRVLDEKGDPVLGVEVMAYPFLLLDGSHETDVQGSFELEELPPGRIELQAYHPSIPGAIASAAVTLAPGHTSSVELRFEEPDPVRVRGRITRNGEPIACSLGLRSRSFGNECTSGTDGRFEVTLQRPGEWRGVAWTGSDQFFWRDLSQTDVRRFDVSVPDAGEHSIELEFEKLLRLTSMDELFR